MKEGLFEWKLCDICGFLTDSFCVSCEQWICLKHIQTCVQCRQLVCSECYQQDKCCLVRPWGEKQERHLRNFYQNKLVDRYGISLVARIAHYEGNEHRKDALKRSIAEFVANFDADAFMFFERGTARDFFPAITKYVGKEETRLIFIAFMNNLLKRGRSGLTYTFLNSSLREELLSVMDESIRSNKNMQSALNEYALESKELFRSLKDRGLLNFEKDKFHTIHHLDALKYMEGNGIDVLNNCEDFKRFVRHSPVEIMEYLIVEKGMTVKYMSDNRGISCDVLKLVYKVKGMDGVQSIDPAKIVYDLETVKFLKSIGCKFDETLRDHVVWKYPLICFDIEKLEDLDENQSENFLEYVRNHDIKACRHMIPFMKEIRKRKIMTVLLCMKTLYPLFQKEIIWNIIDLAYSPLNERG